MFLGDLITLGKVGINIVLSIKLDERRNATTKGKGASDRFVETVLVENGKHSWNSEIHITDVGVRFVQVGAERGF